MESNRGCTTHFLSEEGGDLASFIQHRVFKVNPRGILIHKTDPGNHLEEEILNLSPEC